MQIVHLSDIHIRKNPSRNEEYKEVFDNLFLQLKNIKPSIIVVTGDLVHDKLTMFPEQIGLLLYFLSNLEKIAPLILIRGNHDYNEKNPSREDILEQLVKYNTLTNTTFLLDSGFYQDTNYSDIVWAVWNHKDKMNPWRDIKNPFNRKEKLFIDLYHDPIIGCKLPFGTSSEGKIRSSITHEDFLGDIAMLGDIHKYQSFRDGKIAYAGSLIQQDYGEEPFEHGFILWDTSNLTHTFIKVTNNYGFHKIHLNEDSSLEDTTYKFSSKPKLSVVWKDFNFKIEKEKEILTFFKKFNPLEIKLEKRPLLHKNEIDLSESILADIGRKDVQNSIIEEYLKERQYSKEIINEVLNLDKFVDSKIEQIEDVSNTKDIFIERLVIENFMSYENLDLDWSSLQGIISINAPNKSGKTTLFSALCWLLFGKTLYTGKEKEDVFNKVTKADKVSVSGLFKINGAQYGIERSITRKLGKTEYKYSSINLDFFVYENNEKKYLTDEQRVKTQKEIDSWIGSYDDFIRNNIVTSDVLNTYIAATPATLIDSLLKDLGMNYYEIKLEEFKKIVKEKNNKEGIIKLNPHEITLEKENYIQNLNSFNTKLKEETDKKNKIAQRIEKGTNLIMSVKEQMYKIDDTYSHIDEETEKSKIKTQLELIKKLENEINTLTIEYNKIESFYDKILHNESKEQLNIIRENLKKYYTVLQEINSNIHTKEKEKNKLISELNSIDSKKELIEVNYNKELLIINTKLSDNKNLVDRKKEKINELEIKLDNLSTNSICSRCNYEIVNIDAKEFDKQKKDIENQIEIVKDEINNINKNDFSFEKKEIESSYNAKLIDLENFVQNAREQISLIENEISSLLKRRDKGESTIKDTENKEKEILSLISKQEEYLQNSIKREKIKSTIDIIPHKIENSKFEIEKIKTFLESYEKVKIQIEKNKELNLKIKEYNDVLKELKDEINSIELNMSTLDKQIVVTEKNIKDIDERIERYEKQQKEREIWDLYMSVLHRDGVPSFILKKSINVLNLELSKILEDTGVVFYFDEDLNMIMENEYSGEKQRALQGSGAERTFMAIALKVVSRIINNNVRYNFLLLDECLDKLDEENTDIFKKFIRETKRIIPIIPLISHTDSLSEIADFHFDIEKINGVSKLTIR